ncbi:hypothetical protein OTU49_012817 [Cherax quadricarinatus]|uniref:Uncharacterized protein n=1 Tax=Cherax quadricarinatus TaxID=27406 RepID=A0AAW0VXS3_CHEQU
MTSLMLPPSVFPVLFLPATSHSLTVLHLTSHLPLFPFCLPPPPQIYIFSSTSLFSHTISLHIFTLHPFYASIVFHFSLPPPLVPLFPCLILFSHFSNSCTPSFFIFLIPPLPSFLHSISCISPISFSF